MYSPEIHYLVSQEQHKDRLRKLEQHLLYQTDGSTTHAEPRHRQAVRWLGSQMVKLGTKLEQLDTTPASDAI